MERSYFVLLNAINWLLHRELIVLLSNRLNRILRTSLHYILLFRETKSWRSIIFLLWTHRMKSFSIKMWRFTWMKFISDITRCLPYSLHHRRTLLRFLSFRLISICKSPIKIILNLLIKFWLSLILIWYELVRVSIFRIWLSIWRWWHLWTRRYPLSWYYWNSWLSGHKTRVWFLGNQGLSSWLPKSGQGIRIWCPLLRL